MGLPEVPCQGAAQSNARFFVCVEFLPFFGLSVYINADGEVILKQPDQHGGEDAIVIIPPRMVEDVVEAMRSLLTKES